MVLILPMRNGNISSALRGFFFVGFCSYPTYEEWKLGKICYYLRKGDCSFLSYLWGMETPFQFFKFCFIGVGSFLSYLWGMETYPVY